MRFERVERGVLEPAVHDVDRLETVQRRATRPVLAHHEIAALGEVHADLDGEEGVLDVGRVARPAREDHDAWAASSGGRLGDQRLAQDGRMMGDRRHRRAAQRVGQRAVP